MKEMKKLDFPFDEVVEGAKRKIAAGFTVYQKFSCANCGTRLGIDEPNRFYTTGTCPECEHVTDIRKQGCNYMMTGNLGDLPSLDPKFDPSKEK
jgi:hypothetical protein